jgi:hypothetical protein
MPMFFRSKGLTSSLAESLSSFRPLVLCQSGLQRRCNLTTVRSFDVDALASALHRLGLAYPCLRVPGELLRFLFPDACMLAVARTASVCTPFVPTLEICITIRLVTRHVAKMERSHVNSTITLNAHVVHARNAQCRCVRSVCQGNRTLP